MTDRVTLADAPVAVKPSVWARIRAFSRRDWLDLAEASWTLASAHAALRWQSPARVIARAISPQTTRAAAFTPARLQQVTWLVGVAGRRVMPVPCLSRSVALARVLARRGVATSIRVGVRTIDGRLDAHAWVELDGRVINDDAAHVRQYAPFAEPLTGLAAIRSRIQ